MRAGGIEWRRLEHDHCLVALARAGPRAGRARTERGGRLLHPVLRCGRDRHQRARPSRDRRTAVGPAPALFRPVGDLAPVLPQPVSALDEARSRVARRRFADRGEGGGARRHPARRDGAGGAAGHGLERPEHRRRGAAERTPVRRGPGRSPHLADHIRRSAFMTGSLFVLLILAGIVIIVVARTAVVVPQQSAYVVERLGRFHATMSAGFHVLLPFVDVIRYRHSLKERAIDIPAQVCITRDNVQVGVDGILYLKVMNAERASYGISDFVFAITQLAQTNLRSEVGKIDLDRTFEERTNINTAVVTELDKASEAWGVKVLRYEIKNITPPQDVLAAMEKQMRAEREKRAIILASEGQRDAAVNTADGQKQQVIKASEATREQRVNEAEGQAAAILSVATATAEGIRKIAEALKTAGGQEAMQLRIAEQYIAQFGQLARAGNSLVIPSNLSDVGSMLALAMNVIQSKAGAGRPPAPPARP